LVFEEEANISGCKIYIKTNKNKRIMMCKIGKAEKMMCPIFMKSTKNKKVKKASVLYYSIDLSLFEILEKFCYLKRSVDI
jgi:hypothetical protein